MSSMSTLLNDARKVVGDDYSLGDLFTDVMTFGVTAANNGTARSYEAWLDVISSRPRCTVRKTTDDQPVENSAPQISAV